MKHILKEFNSEYKESNTLKHLLTARGVLDIDNYLNINSSAKHDPFLLTNMKEGVELFNKHIKNKSKIFIQIDSDFDGWASSAIIYNYIKLLDESIEVFYEVHKNKHHGLVSEKVPENIDLVIVPDAGSNDFKEHKEMKNRGIDVIVIDHHICDTFSEDAIVINNQMSDSYPNKTLCGGAMVYKFCEAYDKTYGLDYAKSQLDLCATSLVADMMDLRDLETHYYVNQGLRNITNLGLQAIIQAQEFSLKNQPKLTPTGISFYIAPLVNAIVRIGTREEKILLFKAFIEGDQIVPSTKKGSKGKFETIATQATRVAVNARNRQETKIKIVLEELDFKIKKNELFLNSIIFIPIEEEEFDSALTGLIAMKICAQYKKPTIVARKNSDGFWRGSARGLGTVEIGSLKEFFDNSKMFEYTAGHDEAHGVSIHESKVDSFIKYANEKLSDIEFNENTYEVDFVFDINDNFLYDSLFSLGEGSEFWGQGIKEPKILIKNIPVFATRIFKMGSKKDSVKINANQIDFVKFKDLDFIDSLETFGSVSLNVVGRANLNHWGGQTSVQFFIDDYEMRDNTADF